MKRNLNYLNYSFLLLFLTISGLQSSEPERKATSVAAAVAAAKAEAARPEPSAPTVVPATVAGAAAAAITEDRIMEREPTLIQEPVGPTYRFPNYIREVQGPRYTVTTEDLDYSNLPDTVHGNSIFDFFYGKGISAAIKAGGPEKFGDLRRLLKFIKEAKDKGTLDKELNEPPKNPLAEAFTPIMLAANRSNPHFVEILLANGARLDIKSNFGRTFFDIAKDIPEMQELLKRLKDQGVALPSGADL